MTDAFPLPVISGDAVHQLLRQHREIELLDVPEVDPFAQAHPLFAVQMSAGRIELDAPWRLPRRAAQLVVYDDGEGLAGPAAHKLQNLGYTAVALLEADAAGSGLAAWRAGGGELFRDVNVPSKAFGELVEHQRQTPSLPAEQVKALIDAGANMVVLDVRRSDEFQTMSIPGGTSVPGAELLLRVRDLAPDPATRVIVNCAGRTRSLIGAQSLVNAGIPNPVAALRNGTIGWALAGLASAASAGAAPRRRVLVCSDGRLSAWAAADLQALGHADVAVLAGGLAAWVAAGQPVEAGTARLFSPRIDRYRRPYEGTDAPRSAMQAYLDWEFGLVAQLASDATHGFAVLPAA